MSLTINISNFTRKFMQGEIIRTSKLAQRTCLAQKKKKKNRKDLIMKGRNL